MKKLFFVLFCLVGPMSVYSQEWVPNIKKLQKYPSTEEDVNRLFDSPKIVNEFPPTSGSTTRLVDYHLPVGTLRVQYAGGKCSESIRNIVDVEKGVIIGFYLDLTPPMKISKLDLGIGKLDWQQEADTFARYYFDRKKGLTYSVYKEELHRLDFVLPERYARKCPEK